MAIISPEVNSEFEESITLRSYKTLSNHRKCVTLDTSVNSSLSWATSLPSKWGVGCRSPLRSWWFPQVSSPDSGTGLSSHTRSKARGALPCESGHSPKVLTSSPVRGGRGWGRLGSGGLALLQQPGQFPQTVLWCQMRFWNPEFFRFTEG